MLHGVACRELLSAKAAQADLVLVLGLEARVVADGHFVADVVGCSKGRDHPLPQGCDLRGVTGAHGVVWDGWGRSLVARFG